MSWLAKTLRVFALLILPIFGCVEVTEAPDHVELVFAVQEFFEQTALEGVQFCETDPTNCVMTDADGNAKIALPANQNVSYTLEKERYASRLWADVTDGSFNSFGTFNMHTDEWMKDNADVLMTPYPFRDTGAIVIMMFPPSAGATFELANATGKAFYSDEDWSWSSELAETTFRGWGGFVEVGPGEVEVELGGTAEGCTKFRAWPSSTRARIWVPVRVGYTTYASIGCPRP